MMWLVLLWGCDIELPPERNCDTRTAYYPDADGNGLGEPTSTYLGCEAPEGWVTTLDPNYTDPSEATHTGE